MQAELAAVAAEAVVQTFPKCAASMWRLSAPQGLLFAAASTFVVAFVIAQVDVVEVVPLVVVAAAAVAVAVAVAAVFVAVVAVAGAGAVVEIVTLAVAVEDVEGVLSAVVVAVELAAEEEQS